MDKVILRDLFHEPENIRFQYSGMTHLKATNVCPSTYLTHLRERLPFYYTLLRCFDLFMEI